MCDYDYPWFRSGDVIPRPGADGERASVAQKNIPTPPFCFCPYQTDVARIRKSLRYGKRKGTFYAEPLVRAYSGESTMWRGANAIRRFFSLLTNRRFFLIISSNECK
jgi:hypothetical protein